MTYPISTLGDLDPPAPGPLDRVLAPLGLTDQKRGLVCGAAAGALLAVLLLGMVRR